MRSGAAVSSSSATRQRRLFLLLQQCRYSARQLSQVHAQILLHGLSHNPSLLHKLISSAASCGDLPRAILAFDLAPAPSTTAWNQIIRCFARSPTPHVSLALYNRMKSDSDARPNGYTYSFLLNACASPGLLLQGAQVHGSAVKTGLLSSIFVRTSLIDMYASRDLHDAARKVFDEMPLKNVACWNSMLNGYLRCRDMKSARKLFDEMPRRDKVSWTTMIAGCARMGRSKQALSLFRGMWDEGMDVDQDAAVAALSACADLGDLELGRWIHGYANGCLRGGVRLVSLDNSLVNMYVKCGSIDESYHVFRVMPRRSTISWTTMIMGLIIHCRCEEALKLFQEMLQGAEQPDDVTYIWVFLACGRAKQLDLGRHYFEQMTKRFNIEPRMQHYGCLVDMLSRAGHVDDAREMIDRMPMEPNDAIWSMLLGACRLNGNLDMVNHIAGKLLEVSGGGNLAFLSNVYAVLGNWHSVLCIRKRMAETGLPKPAGRSCVLINGYIHEFMSGVWPKQHDHTIHRMLYEMVERAKGEGYVPDVSQVMLDVENEEKESLLYAHSEKLALAFALMTMDVSSPVRITMNLRMCSDCHSLARFVSVSFRRDIVVRERNRFHHFSGGLCSCNP